MAKPTRDSAGLLARTSQFDDWGDPWPHDPPGYVFLARAFEQIGRAIYRDGWAASAEDLEPEMPPEDCDDETEEKYDLACEEAEVEFEKMNAKVAAVIAEQFEGGRLVSALRERRGGEMRVLEAHYWNTEDYKDRFSTWRMSAKHPFSSLYQGDCWIFVARKSLDDYLSGLGSQALRHREQKSDRSLALGEGMPRRRHGRTPGSGAYDCQDMPLLKKMRGFIESGEAKSPHQAAGKVANEAQGASFESKQTRLGKKYRAKGWPTSSGPQTEVKA